MFAWFRHAARYELQQQGLGEAEKIRAIGDAEAARLAARADVIRQNPELVALIRAEAALNWDGKLPERMFPTTALPLLQLPGPMCYESARTQPCHCEARPSTGSG
jgi:hypothetical protein